MIWKPLVFEVFIAVDIDLATCLKLACAVFALEMGEGVLLYF